MWKITQSRDNAISFREFAQSRHELVKKLKDLDVPRKAVIPNAPKGTFMCNGVLTVWEWDQR